MEHVPLGVVSAAVEELIEIAVSAEAELDDRLKAIERLSSERCAEVIVPLTVELKQAEDALADALQTTLKKLDAVIYFTQELQSQSVEERLLAAELLEVVADERAVSVLIAALSKDPEPKVRELAADALSRFAEERVVDGLESSLAADTDPDVRSASAQALGRIGGDRAQVALTSAQKGEQDDFVLILIEEALDRIELETIG